MKQQMRVEEMLLAHPQGLTHRELALHLGMPEPSARRALQAVRAGRPRFKAGKGMFDVVESGARGPHKVFKVQWRATKSYDPAEVKVTLTGEDGVKREVKPFGGDAIFPVVKDEPADFDAGSGKVA